METLITKACQTHRLSKDEIMALLANDAAEKNLAAAADDIRRRYVGDGVHLRGLIEFSNICRQNCMYCGLRRDNRRLERYRLEPEEILRLAKNAHAYGYQTVVLQSGEDIYFTADLMADLIKKMKALDLAVTLSIGERTFEEYQVLRNAGADRYLLRIETTDPLLYEALDPHMSHANRLRCLRDLKTLGYEVGTGSLVGLPGQSIASLAEDILFFQEIDADMIGIGPFIPNQDTPLGKEKRGDFGLTRRMVALTRLMLPEANIPATTAVGTVRPDGREIMLASGANVIMPNVTEGEARQKYALYPGKICVDDTPTHCRSCIEGKIKGLGRFVATDKGFRRRGK